MKKIIGVIGWDDSYVFRQLIFDWQGLTFDSLACRLSEHGVSVSFLNILGSRSAALYDFCESCDYLFIQPFIDGTNLGYVKSVACEIGRFYRHKMLYPPECYFHLESKLDQSIWASLSSSNLFPESFWVDGDRIPTIELGPAWVIKTSSGYGSTGVTRIEENIRHSSSKAAHQGLMQRLRSEVFDQLNRRRNFVVAQTFIPDLTHDYKVLIFFDVIAVLRRNVRDRDFRASGSGDFEAVHGFSSEITERLLNQLMRFRESQGAPTISVDVAIQDGTAKILEWQSLHFGTSTLCYVKNSFIRSPDSSRWRVGCLESVDTLFAYSWARGLGVHQTLYEFARQKSYLFSIGLVIHPSNKTSQVKRCFASCVNQTGQTDDVEIQIIFNGLTEAELKAYQNELRTELEAMTSKFATVKILHETEAINLSGALNYLVRRTNSKYFMRIDCDDEMLPDRVKNTRQFVENNPDVDVVAGWAEIIDHPEVILKKTYDQNQHPVNLFTNPIIHPAVTFKTVTFLNSGGYSHQFNRGQDCELWLRMYKFGAKFLTLKKPLIKYRVASSSSVSLSDYTRLTFGLIYWFFRYDLNPFLFLYCFNPIVKYLIIKIGLKKFLYVFKNF